MPNISIKNEKIYCDLSGAGPLAVLLIHGSGEDHTLWDGQRPALESHFAVAALDLNGHGQSPARAGDGLSTYTEDVLAVLADMNQPAVVMGHSLGGAVALNVVLQRPERLAAIGLIGSGARLRVLPALLKLIQDDFEGAVDYLLGLMFHRSLPEVVQRSRAMMLRNGQQALLRDFLTCDAFDVMAHLSEIKVPTWVAVAEQDQMTPVKYAGYLAAHLSASKLDVIPQAGHKLMLEQPVAFNQALLAFLETLKPSFSPKLHPHPSPLPSRGN